MEQQQIHTLSNSLSETIQGMFSLLQIFMTVITVFLFISILLKIHARSNSETKSKAEISNKTNKNNQAQSNNQHSSTTKEENKNKEKSNLTIKLDLPNTTIYRPNVDNILSMIKYIDDLQKQIENSSNVNNKNQASSLQLSRIDKSIFIKFNILQEKFILDYQAVNWNNNINQEISNSYQKIYNEHEKLLKEQYNDIKQYLKEYFNQQVVQSKEELDVINKIIN